MTDFEKRIQAELARLGALREQGVIADEPEPEIQCAYCGDFGMVRADVPLDHPMFGKMLPCPNPDCVVSKERTKAQWQKRLILSRLPERYERCTFASWKRALSEEALDAKLLPFEAARAFCSDGSRVDLYAICTALEIEWDMTLDSRPKNSLVFHGDYGVGKTGLAAAAFNCLMKKGIPGMYIDTGDLFLDVQATFRADADETTKEAMLRYKEAPLLFIDDLQVLNDSDFRIETIEAIIRHRHAKFLPTLITTNLSQNRFRDLWQGPAAHRLAQMAHWVLVPPPVLRVMNPSIGG